MSYIGNINTRITHSQTRYILCIHHINHINKNEKMFNQYKI